MQLSRSVSCSNWNQDVITCSLWGKSEEMDWSQHPCQGFALDVVLTWQAWPHFFFFKIRNQCLQQCRHMWRRSWVECASVSSCIWRWLAYHHLATTLFPVYRCLAGYFDALMKALCWGIALLTSPANKWVVRLYPQASRYHSLRLDRYEISCKGIQRSNSWTETTVSPLSLWEKGQGVWIDSHESSYRMSI